MLEIASYHLQRLETALLRKHSMANLGAWIQEHTRLGGLPFSFVDHEYQLPIVTDTSREVNVRKCSQVGVSEVSARLSLAMVNVVQPFTTIYTLPTAHFAATFMKTRIDPVIDGSQTMKDAVHRTNDNSEIKQFGESFLYVKGAASSNAPISIPADAIVSDETDFSDQEVLSQYTSRLKHSKWKIIRKFSTPTVPNFGVDKAFQESRRFFNHVKCNHCNHWFVPDYYEHVKIPGYTGYLREINKQTLARIRWQEAAVVCPKCGGLPSLQVEHREFVCENPEENLVGAGYQVSPFDAPNIVRVSEIVKESTDYTRQQDFVNFTLGLPMEDSEATLMRSDLEHLFINVETGMDRAYVMGVDVGNLYHFVVGAVDGPGDVTVVHTEQVPMGRAKIRYEELRRQFRVQCTVIDSNPHSETVMSLQQIDATCYAAVYVNQKGIQTHTVQDKEQEDKEGIAFLRQVKINRSRAFDGYMTFLRDNHLRFKDSMNKELLIAHHISMKRIRIYDKESGETSYSWQKTDGEDHFHHASMYCWMASLIMGVAKPQILLPTYGMYRIKIKEKVVDDRK